MPVTTRDGSTVRLSAIDAAASAPPVTPPKAPWICEKLEAPTFTVGRNVEIFQRCHDVTLFFACFAQSVGCFSVAVVASL